MTYQTIRSHAPRTVKRRRHRRALCDAFVVLAVVLVALLAWGVVFAGAAGLAGLIR